MVEGDKRVQSIRLTKTKTKQILAFRLEDYSVTALQQITKKNIPS